MVILGNQSQSASFPFGEWLQSDVLLIGIFVMAGLLLIVAYRIYSTDDDSDSDRSSGILEFNSDVDEFDMRLMGRSRESLLKTKAYHDAEAMWVMTAHEIYSYMFF